MANPPLTREETRFLTQDALRISTLARLIVERKYDEVKKLVDEVKQIDPALLQQPLIEAGAKDSMEMITFLSQHGAKDITYGLVALMYENTKYVKSEGVDSGLILRTALIQNLDLLRDVLHDTSALPIIPPSIKYLQLGMARAYFFLLQDELGIPQGLALSSGYGGISGNVKLTYQNVQQALLGPYKEPYPFSFQFLSTLGGAFDPYYLALFLSQTIRDNPFDYLHDDRVTNWAKKILRLDQVRFDIAMSARSEKPQGENTRERFYSEQDIKNKIAYNSKLENNWDLIFRRLQWVNDVDVQKELKRRYKSHNVFYNVFYNGSEDPSPEIMDKAVAVEVNHEFEQPRNPPYESTNPVPFEPRSGFLGWAFRKALLWKSVVGPWTPGWLQVAFDKREEGLIPLSSVLEATEYLIDYIPQLGMLGSEEIPLGSPFDNELNKLSKLLELNGLPVMEMILRKGRLDLYNSVGVYTPIESCIKSLNIDPITSLSSSPNLSPQRNELLKTLSIEESTREVYKRIALAARDGGLTSLFNTLAPQIGDIPAKRNKPTFVAFRADQMREAMKRADDKLERIKPQLLKLAHLPLEEYSPVRSDKRPSKTNPSANPFTPWRK
jgi:hypothetical protein